MHIYRRLARASIMSILSAFCLATPVLAGGTFTPKYVLPAPSNTAPNGAWPRWELTTAGGLMYGVTPSYGATSGGTLFSISTSGAFQKIRDFGPSGDINGSQPNGPILAFSGVYYGVTGRGGTNNKGVLYKWSPASGYQVVYHFGSGTMGSMPSGPLLAATDGKVYGTTSMGGICNQGSIFKFVPATGGVTLLYSLCDQDGNNAMTGVIQANDGNLYGTAYTGGPYDGGTLFRLTTAGVFSRLAVFGSGNLQPKFPSRLTQGRDGLLYGTSYRGGDNTTYGMGTLFSSTLAGDISVRASFFNVGGLMSLPSPWAALNERFINVFYGIAIGQNGGNIFQFRSSTNAVTNVHGFGVQTPNWPEAGLVQGPDGNLWGSTTDGGNLYLQKAGTVYNIQALTANP